jgi:hypothetical protein
VKKFRIFCVKEQQGSQDFEQLQKIFKYAEAEILLFPTETLSGWKTEKSPLDSWQRQKFFFSPQ